MAKINIEEVNFDIEVDGENVLISVNGDYDNSMKSEINKFIGKELTLNIENQELNLR